MDKETDIYLLFIPGDSMFSGNEVLDYAVSSEIEAKKFLAEDPCHSIKKIKVFSTREECRKYARQQFNEMVRKHN